MLFCRSDVKKIHYLYERVKVWHANPRSLSTLQHSCVLASLSRWGVLIRPACSGWQVEIGISEVRRDLRKQCTKRRWCVFDQKKKSELFRIFLVLGRFGDCRLGTYALTTTCMYLPTIAGIFQLHEIFDMEAWEVCEKFGMNGSGESRQQVWWWWLGLVGLF